MLAKVEGFYPPLMTPFDGDFNVDVPALERLVKRVLEAGAGGIFTLGSSSEGYQMLDGQKREVVDRVLEFANGRVPVIAGFGDMSTPRMIALAKRLTRSGLDGLVAIVPFSSTNLSQRAMHDHFAQLADAIELPLIIYNNPSLTGHQVNAETIARLAGHPNIIGTKDSTRNFGHFCEVLRLAGGRDDFGILQGHEWCLDASMRMGADGLVTGSGTLVPDIPVQIIEAVRRGDHDEAAKLQQRLLSILRLYGPNFETVISGLKYALSRLGLCQAFCLRPAEPLDEANRARIDLVLKQQGFL